MSVHTLGAASAVPLKTTDSVTTQPPEPPAPRPPWGFCFDAAELAKPGRYLISAIQGRADQLNLPMKDALAEMGFGYGYLNQLANGHKDVSNASVTFYQSVARFLGVSQFIVEVLAGRIPPEALSDMGDLLVHEVPRAIRFINEDFEWGARFGANLDNLAYNQQLMVVRMYERATGRVLLRPEANVGEFLADHWPRIVSAREEFMALIASQQSEENPPAAAR